MHEIKQFDDIKVGDRTSIAKTITEADGALYVAATGDFGPVHVDEGYAKRTRFGERIAPGIMVAGIATSVLTARLVGILGVSIEDQFQFTGPVRYGDTVTFNVWIAEKHPENRTMIWEASATNQEGLEVLRARATLKFPRLRPAMPTGS
jgi:3-hydroxybutyryl-CoA dehydratase